MTVAGDLSLKINLAALKWGDKEILTLSQNPEENITLGEIKHESEEFMILINYLFEFLTKGHEKFARNLAEQISDFYMKDINHSVTVLFT